MIGRLLDLPAASFLSYEGALCSYPGKKWRQIAWKDELVIEIGSKILLQYSNKVYINIVIYLYAYIFHLL